MIYIVFLSVGPCLGLIIQELKSAPDESVASRK